jgi:hypothetical protein
MTDETSIASLKNERVRGWNFNDWGGEFPVDVMGCSAERGRRHCKTA